MFKPFISGHSLIVVLCGFLSLLSGCAAVGTNVAYEGKRLPGEKVAIIRPDLASQWTNVSVRFVDGKDMGGCGPFCDVEMLPGKHQIGVNWLYQPNPAFPIVTLYVGTFEFDAKAGKEYVLRASMAQDQPLIWLEEKATHKVVGRTIASKFKKNGEK